jgi:hypothetical protein
MSQQQRMSSCPAVVPLDRNNAAALTPLQLSGSGCPVCSCSTPIRAARPQLDQGMPRADTAQITALTGNLAAVCAGREACGGGPQHICVLHDLRGAQLTLGKGRAAALW